MPLHMSFPYSTLFSFFVFLFLAVYALRFRNSPGASYFILSMLLNAFLAITSVFELMSEGLPLKLLWRNFEQIPLFMSAISYYGMVMVLTGTSLNKVRKQILWLGLPIFLYLLLIFTDSYHHLMRGRIGLEPFGGLLRIQLQSTKLSLLFIGYAKTIGLLASFYLLIRMRTVSRYNRSQYMLVLLSAFIPYAMAPLANVIKLEVSMAVSCIPSGLLLFYALFHYKLLRVRPMAKDKIIEHLKEGVLVVGTNDVIIDMNPSSIPILERIGSAIPGKKYIGKNVRSVLEAQPALLQVYEEAAGGETVVEGAAPFHYSVSVIPIGAGNHQTGTLIIFTDISERLAYESELLHRAAIDGLTQVYNRQYIMDATTALMEHNQTLALMLIDIDFFKTINDSYGHQTGDQVLVQVAAIIRDTTGSRGIVGRMGGEEFAVVLPGMSVQEANELAEAIRGITEQTVFVEEHTGVELRCTLSIGVSEKKTGLSTLKDLYHEADMGLYRSKSGGRNRTTMA